MDDRLRAQVIERLMCDMDIDLDAFTTRHGLPQDSFDDDLRKLSGLEADGFVIISGRRLRVTEEGRAFLRHVAAAFDRHLDMDMPQRHASGV